MPSQGQQGTATMKSKGSRGTMSTIGALGRGPTYMRVTTPANLDLALEGLVRKVLREQPKQEDIYAFAADYFETLVEIRDRAEIPNAQVRDICPEYSEAEASQLIKLATSFARPAYAVKTSARSEQEEMCTVIENLPREEEKADISETSEETEQGDKSIVDSPDANQEQKDDVDNGNEESNSENMNSEQIADENYEGEKEQAETLETTESKSAPTEGDDKEASEEKVPDDNEDVIIEKTDGDVNDGELPQENATDEPNNKAEILEETGIEHELEEVVDENAAATDTDTSGSSKLIAAESIEHSAEDMQLETDTEKLLQSEKGEIHDEKDVIKEFIDKEKEFATLGNCTKSFELAEVYDKVSETEKDEKPPVSEDQIIAQEIDENVTKAETVSSDVGTEEPENTNEPDIDVEQVTGESAEHTDKANEIETNAPIGETIDTSVEELNEKKSENKTMQVEAMAVIASGIALGMAAATTIETKNDHIESDDLQVNEVNPIKQNDKAESNIHAEEAENDFEEANQELNGDGIRKKREVVEQNTENDENTIRGESETITDAEESESTDKITALGAVLGEEKNAVVSNKQEPKELVDGFITAFAQESILDKETGNENAQVEEEPVTKDVSPQVENEIENNEVSKILSPENDTSDRKEESVSDSDLKELDQHEIKEHESETKVMVNVADVTQEASEAVDIAIETATRKLNATEDQNEATHEDDQEEGQTVADDKPAVSNDNAEEIKSSDEDQPPTNATSDLNQESVTDASNDDQRVQAVTDDSEEVNGAKGGSSEIVMAETKNDQEVVTAPTDNGEKETMPTTEAITAEAEDNQELITSATDDNQEVITYDIEDNQALITAATDDNQEVITVDIEDNQELITAATDDNQEVTTAATDDNQEVTTADIDDNLEEITAETDDYQEVTTGDIDDNQEEITSATVDNQEVTTADIDDNQEVITSATDEKQKVITTATDDNQEVNTTVTEEDENRASGDQKTSETADIENTQEEIIVPTDVAQKVLTSGTDDDHEPILAATGEEEKVTPETINEQDTTTARSADQGTVTAATDQEIDRMEQKNEHLGELTNKDNVLSEDVPVINSKEAADATTNAEPADTPENMQLSLDNNSTDTSEENPFISAEVKLIGQVSATPPSLESQEGEDETDVIMPLRADIGTIEELDEDVWGSQVSAIRAAIVIQKNYRKHLARMKAYQNDNNGGGFEGSRAGEFSSTESTTSETKEQSENKLGRFDTAIENTKHTDEVTKKSPRERLKEFANANHTIDDSHVWGTLEKELDSAATTIQQSYKEYKERQRDRLRREDAVQLTSDESRAQSPTMPRLLGTGELHDIIIPEEPGHWL